mmetsp:Transcript_45093/g.84618  ORF Transcript_45093/g.84618 Transcript_45093/m.84618 type:complete len:81 (+) Transcript_45093:130-372(+)
MIVKMRIFWFRTCADVNLSGVILWHFVLANHQGSAEQGFDVQGMEDSVLQHCKASSIDVRRGCGQLGHKKQAEMLRGHPF